MSDRHQSEPRKTECIDARGHRSKAILSRRIRGCSTAKLDDEYTNGRDWCLGLIGYASSERNSRRLSSCLSGAEKKYRGEYGDKGGMAPACHA
jgi:hypothetical protein